VGHLHNAWRVCLAHECPLPLCPLQHLPRCSYWRRCRSLKGLIGRTKGRCYYRSKGACC
jgi:hypothetical protein